MQNTLMVSLGSAALGLVGLSAGVGTAELAERMTKQPEPFAMHLETLEFKDGKFHQSFRIDGGRTATKADWSAEIKRGSDQLCSAGGTAPYNDKSAGASSYTPKQWAGADCPDVLLSGDVANAVWEYRNIAGFVVSISGSITIK